MKRHLLLPLALLLSCATDETIEPTPLTPAPSSGGSRLCKHCAGPVAFADPVDIAAGSVLGVSSLDAGDIDGDGLVDVAVIEGGKHATGETFAWFEAPSDEGGAWTRHEFNPAAPLKAFLGSAKLVDIDNDGDNDLVMSSDNHSGTVKDADVLVFVNPLPTGDVTGSWDYEYLCDGEPWHHINDMEVADLDNDGLIDVVVRSLDPNEIHLFFQNSVSSWTRTSIPTDLARSEGLAVGLLNADPLPDITFTGFVLRAPTAPRTQDYVRLAIDSTYYTVNQNTKEAIGDIDGDNLPDVVIAPAEAYRNGGDQDLAWYRNPGGDLSGQWTKTIVVPSTNNTHTVKLARIDDDPHLDIVAGVAWDARSITVYYNDGAGDFGSSQTVSSTNGLYSGVVADVGNDGDMDIIGQETYAKSSKPWVYESLLSGAASVECP